MISSNDLSTFILHHNLNRTCNKNICSIQDLMRTSNPASDTFKCVCKDFPNLDILTKSATPGETQLASAQESVRNKYLGESVTAFTHTESLEATAVVSIDYGISLSNAGNNIRIPITKVLLCAAVRDLSRSKKHRE